MLALSIAVACVNSAHAADAAVFVGQPLTDALRLLSSQQGLATVFSTDLVSAKLRVKQIPQTSDPVAMRAQLLAQHGLRCAEVRKRCVVEVDDSPDATTAPAAPDAQTKAPDEHATLLHQVDVSPSHYALMTEGADFLSADAIAATPHLADDVFRLARSLPGVAGGDISAPFHVRGGQSDEIALRLDGLELYKPFHLHSLNNFLGIIDSNLIGGIDIYTGAWPSRFGGRMSAVMDIRSREVDAEIERRVGVSAINAFYTHAQSSDDGERSFIGSARTGYLDFVLNFVDPGGEVDPRYYDVFARYQQRLNDRHNVSMQLLNAGDDVTFETDDGLERSDGRSDASYLWLRWQADWSERWQSESILAYTALDQRRVGFALDNFETNARVRDRRDLQGFRIGHQVNGNLSARSRIEFGAEWRDESTDYDYHSVADTFPLFSPLPIRVQRDFAQRVDGAQGALWLDGEVMLSDRWQLRSGLRYSYYAPAARSDSSVDPHLALSWRTPALGTLRLGLARVSQSQRSDELAVPDGEFIFSAPERSTHWVLGWEQQFAAAIHVRAELFHKRWAEPRPRYQNLFEPIELFPETESDRVLVAPDRASSQGIEIALGGGGEGGRWWSRYVYSRAREHENGAWFARSWDQPHALHLGWDRRIGEHWRITTQLDTHSGWPTTPVHVFINGEGRLEAELGKRNSDRFDPYINLSARISRFRQYADSSLTWYFEVFNLLDQENANAVERFVASRNADGTVTVDRILDGGLPIVPSFGVLWKF